MTVIAFRNLLKEFVVRVTPGETQYRVSTTGATWIKYAQNSIKHALREYHNHHLFCIAKLLGTRSSRQTSVNRCLISVSTLQAST